MSSPLVRLFHAGFHVLGSANTSWLGWSNLFQVIGSDDFVASEMPVKFEMHSMICLIEFGRLSHFLNCFIEFRPGLYFSAFIVAAFGLSLNVTSCHCGESV